LSYRGIIIKCRSLPTVPQAVLNGPYGWSLTLAR